MERVAVFLDYENVHRTGHQLFANTGQPKYETAVDLIRIAEKIVAKRRKGGSLTSIRVFRGRPVPEVQPKPASANDTQAAAWLQDGRVELKRRDLKYDFDANRQWIAAREKGIDVALAISLVAGALSSEFDVAVVFSCDTTFCRRSSWPPMEPMHTSKSPAGRVRSPCGFLKACGCRHRGDCRTATFSTMQPLRMPGLQRALSTVDRPWAHHRERSGPSK